MEDTTFSNLTDDIILQILFYLQDDPRNWARLSCVSTKFNSLITSICFKSKFISSSFHSFPSDLLSLSTSWSSLYKLSVCCPGLIHAGIESAINTLDSNRRILLRSHLASGGWNLSREQGSKLLGSRFRDDCLYISEWPGCVHIEEKRSYRLFRGIFKDFKKSIVWRTINDKSKIEMECEYCKGKESWDLLSAFCLKRGFGYHDDGEPVVRAFVCENGHVSGAWTDFPLYA